MAQPTLQAWRPTGEGTLSVYATYSLPQLNDRATRGTGGRIQLVCALVRRALLKNLRSISNPARGSHPETSRNSVEIRQGPAHQLTAPRIKASVNNREREPRDRVLNSPQGPRDCGRRSPADGCRIADRHFAPF
jgi:hypothetical protein